MACCCAKINKCQNDITKISDARGAIQVMKSNNGSLDTRLSELSGKMQEMATPDNIGSCATAIKNMNKGSVSIIDSMINQCTSKINALKNDKERYEREDKEYHQELAKQPTKRR